jgi:hypothetical protein
MLTTIYLLHNYSEREMIYLFQLILLYSIQVKLEAIVNYGKKKKGVLLEAIKIKDHHNSF